MNLEETEETSFDIPDTTRWEDDDYTNFLEETDEWMGWPEEVLTKFFSEFHKDDPKRQGRLDHLLTEQKDE